MTNDVKGREPVAWMYTQAESGLVSIVQTRTLLPDGWAETPLYATSAPDLEKRVAELEEENAKLRRFAREIIQVSAFEGNDLGGDSVQELAEAHGLIRCVAYDPDEHGGTEHPVDAGDDWFVFSGALQVKPLDKVQGEGW